MEPTTIAIDLAKNVFELAVAHETGKVLDRKRLSRNQLRRYFENCPPAHVVMEACGSAHYWGRWLAERGMRVSLLPPHYVRAYVRRNKTDRADATALLEASKASDIIPVRVKSAEQQALQSVHRVRSAWRGTLTARINCIRGLCREFGIVAPLGARPGFAELVQHLSQESPAIPGVIRVVLLQMVEEIRSIQERIRQLQLELATIAEHSPVCQRLQKIPGIGVISAHGVCRLSRRHYFVSQSAAVRLLAGSDPARVLVRQHPAFGYHQQARRRVFTDAACPRSPSSSLFG